MGIKENWKNNLTEDERNTVKLILWAGGMVLALLFCAIVGGCATPSEKSRALVEDYSAHLKKDMTDYQEIILEYEQYVINDPHLSKPEKEKRLFTTRSWTTRTAADKARIKDLEH